MSIPNKQGHVLCVYPYRRELGRLNGFYPPLGLEIIAAALSEYSSAIDVIDLRRERLTSRDFLRPDTTMVCFSVNWDKEAAGVRQEIASIPESVLTVIGGRGATHAPNEWMEECPNVDILVRGDGEEAIREIAAGKPPGEISGITYRLDGEVRHTPVRACKPARNDLHPDRSLRRYSYSLNQSGFNGPTFDTVASSRGCPFNCTFCSFSRNPWSEKRGWSARSPEAVVNEIESLDADVVFFVDDNFSHDPDRVADICDLLLARGIRKHYIANARVEIAKRPDVLKKMERAGFAMLLLGIESAQDKTLKAMRKGFDTKRLREYFREFRRTRILLLGYFIIGNIGESEVEMLDSAPLADSLGLDTIQLTMLRNEIYSGLDELVAANPGYHIDSEGLIYSDEYSCDRLQDIRKRIHRQFHTPTRILNMVRKGLHHRIITPLMLLRLPWYFVCRLSEHFSRKRARRARRRAELLRASAKPSIATPALAKHN